MCTADETIAFAVSVVGQAGATLCGANRPGGLADLVWVVAEGLRRLSFAQHPFQDPVGWDPSFVGFEPLPLPPGQPSPSCDPVFCASPPGLDAQDCERPAQLCKPEGVWGGVVELRVQTVVEDGETPPLSQRDPSQLEEKVEEPTEIWYECFDNPQCGESPEPPSVHTRTDVQSSGNDSEENNLVPLSGHGFLTVEDFARARAVGRSWLSIVDDFVQNLSGSSLPTSAVEQNPLPAERVPTGQKVEASAQSVKAFRAQRKRQKRQARKQLQGAVSSQELLCDIVHDGGRFDSLDQFGGAPVIPQVGECLPNSGGHVQQIVVDPVDQRGTREDSQLTPAHVQEREAQKECEDGSARDFAADPFGVLSKEHADEFFDEACRTSPETQNEQPLPWREGAHPYQSPLRTCGEVGAHIHDIMCQARRLTTSLVCSFGDPDSGVAHTVSNMCVNVVDVDPKSLCAAEDQTLSLVKHWRLLRSDFERMFASLQSVEEFREFRRMLLGLNFGSLPSGMHFEEFQCLRRRLDLKCQRPWA